MSNDWPSHPNFPQHWIEVREREWKLLGHACIESFYQFSEHTEKETRHYRIRKHVPAASRRAMIYFRYRSFLCLGDGAYREHDEYMGSENRISKLPVELQLMILNDSGLHPRERDLLVHNNLPHLLNLYIPQVPVTVGEWFKNFCTRENLRFAGVCGLRTAQDRPHLPLVEVWHLWRFRSIDHQPDWAVVPEYEAEEGASLRERGFIPGPPCLAHVTEWLMRILEGLYWVARGTNEFDYSSNPGAYSIEQPRSSIWAELNTEYEAAGLKEPDNWLSTCEEVVFPLPCLDDYRGHTGTGVFMTVSELREVFAQLDVVMRPLVYFSAAALRADTAWDVEFEAFASWCWLASCIETNSPNRGIATNFEDGGGAT